MEKTETTLSANFEPAVSEYSDSDIQKKINYLMRSNDELSEIRNYIIDRKIAEIENEGFATLFKAAIPSFILLIVSFFIDVSSVPFLGNIANNLAKWLFPGTELLNTGVTPIQFWWLPVVSYLVFIFCAFLSNKSLKKEIALRGASEGGISRIIDRYSGIVDAIGTALPLLGAAILLLSIKEGPTIFLGFSVPFEIKSIVVLAIAKLFDAVFDAQALKYQEIQEEIRKVESEYFFKQEESLQKAILSELVELKRGGLGASNNGMVKEISKDQLEAMYKVLKGINDENQRFATNLDHMKKSVAELHSVKLIDPQTMSDVQKVSEALALVATTVNKSTENTSAIRENMEAIRKIVTEINNIKLPDEKALKELQVTSHFLNETITNMKDSAAAKSLENLVYLAGKRQ